MKLSKRSQESVTERPVLQEKYLRKTGVTVYPQWGSVLQAVTHSLPLQWDGGESHMDKSAHTRILK